MRIKEYEYLREMFKKLLYSLEQMNMVNIEEKGLLKDKLSKTGQDFLTTGGLPQLQGAETTKEKGEFERSMEFMMMKRLHFLKNSVDIHNPHETTLRMRDNAMKCRDERILELWKREKNKVDVEVLVEENYKKHQNKVRNDFSREHLAIQSNFADELATNSIHSDADTTKGVDAL